MRDNGKRLNTIFTDLYLHLQNYKCFTSIFCHKNDFVDLKTQIVKKSISRKYKM